MNLIRDMEGIPDDEDEEEIDAKARISWKLIKIGTYNRD